jgi:hypothetical protein
MRSSLFGGAAVNALVGIVSVGVFLVIPCAVVRAFIRIFLAGGGTSTFQFPSTGFADGEVLVASWIGTIDHAVRSSSTDMAARDDRGIDRIYLDRDAVVKDVAFAFKVFAPCFHAVLDDASVELIHIFKTLFQEVG